MEPADPEDVAATGEHVAGTVELPDGTSMPVALDGELVERAQSEGVDVERLQRAAVPSNATVDLTAQTDGDSTATIPVQEHRQTDLTNRLRRDREWRYIKDDQIQRLVKNSVNYTERVGEFLLERDDLIPAVKERLKALIVGEDGLDVEPADPENDADQRLADHLKDIYGDDVRPGDVIDRILKENLMNARAVLRATDLKELDLNDLDYLRDGVSGEEIYVQDRTTVYEFDVDDEPNGGAIPGINLERRTFDARPLVIGEHVFDISLYDSPPLEAVADTAVNKMVLQRLKARKAEITSFGAVYATVEPPSYLPEDQYFDRVQDDDYGDDEQPPTKLERAMKQNIQNAFDTLKDFQSGTVMSVPDFWNLEQLEIPETNQPIDEQIRGYNRDISRRLLIPLDLVELQSGSELSRETMFATLMTTIAGWRREITRVFDNYADAQAEIEGISGDVDHVFPPLKDANTKQIISALQYAGVAGLTQKEVRQMMNAVQGVDLETEDIEQDAPESGGPANPAQRQDEMRQMLEDQRRGADDGGDGDDGGQGPPEGPTGPTPPEPGGAAARAQEGDTFEATLFRVVAPEEDADRYDDNVLGIGVDFPNHDVYVDWRNSVFPDELSNAHVSIYGSIADLEQATGNVVEEIDTLGVEAARQVIDPDSVDALTVTAASADVIFTNVGGDPFGDQDTLDAFVDALREAGADTVYVGGDPYPDVDGIHDRPVSVDGLNVDDARSVWEDFESDAYGLMGPKAEAADVGGGSGNAHPAGGGGGQTTSTAAGSGGTSDRVARILRSVPFLPDPDSGGDDPVTVPAGALKTWLAWVRADRPSITAWNPSLHPRGPDGQFIERPFDVPDDVASDIADLETSDVLDRLVREGELSTGDLESILQDDGVRIDGIPDDVSTRDDLADLPADDGGGGDTSPLSDVEYASPNAPDLSPATSDTEQPLEADSDADLGASAEAMSVHTWEDGREAFVTDIGTAEGEADITTAERTVAADVFLRNIGMGDARPPTVYEAPEDLTPTEDRNYFATERVDGDPVWSAPSGAIEQVDRGDFERFAAAIYLSGDSDPHGQNVFVQDDGSLVVIDSDKAGGDFTNGGEYESRGRSYLKDVATALGFDDFDDDSLSNAVEQLANDIDTESALEGVPNAEFSGADRHQFRENIRTNIQAARDGGIP